MNKLVTILISLSVLISSCGSREEQSHLEATKKDTIQKLQKEYDSTIYVGVVLGSNADTYNKQKTFRSDSIYGLEPLTKSNHQIEIRFYTRSYWIDTTYVAILTYDSTFEMHGIKHFYSYDTSINNNIANRKSFNHKIPVNANPDSVFTKLIENGIFGLTEVDKEDYFKQDARELSKNGLKDGTKIGEVADGTDFILEYKIDTIYNTIYMHSPHVFFQHNPDYQLFRRYYEIMNLMLSGFK